MLPELKDIYREFLVWEAKAVELKITPAFLCLITIDYCHLHSDLPREKTRSWEVIIKVPL